MFGNLADQLLSWVVVYGLPLIFGVVFISSVGLPMPTALVLLAAGSFASQSQLSLMAVLGLSLAAAVGGDHVGYLAGWWGGRRLLKRLAAWLGGEERVQRTRERLRRQGWLAVFLSRWLITPLCTPCNLACGSMSYPLRHFFLADLLGEALYVGLLVALGFWFSDQIEDMSDFLSALGPWLLGLGLAAVLIWVLRHWHSEGKVE